MARQRRQRRGVARFVARQVVDEGKRAAPEAIIDFTAEIERSMMKGNEGNCFLSLSEMDEEM